METQIETGEILETRSPDKRLKNAEDRITALRSNRGWSKSNHNSVFDHIVNSLLTSIILAKDKDLDQLSALETYLGLIETNEELRNKDLMTQGIRDEIKLAMDYVKSLKS
jgi:hypothetical protein